MSSKKDFIKSIGSFTDSLQEVVDALKKSSNNEFEDFFSMAKDQTKIALDIVQSIDDIKKDNKKIKKNTDDILKIVKGINKYNAKNAKNAKSSKSKESSLLTDLGNTGNKNSVAQGAASIAIIAGSIMAIGTAFKIVGDVDFASVVSLGIAIPLIGMAFSEISKNKELTPSSTLKMGASVVIMAGSIALAGALLSTMPSMSLMQGISTVAVAGSMGLALYALSKAVDDTGVTDVAKIVLLTTAMPMVAAGLIGAAFFLNNIPNINVEKGLSAIAVAGAMGLALYGISKAASGLGNSSLGSVIELAVIMPVVAGGLLGSAAILSNFPTINDPLGLATGSLAVAASIGITALAIKSMMLLGLDKNPQGVLEGTLLMPVIAAGLMASSLVLSLGNYSSGPSLEWAQSFGLSMLAAVPSVLILGAVASTGVGALVIGAGLLSLVAIATTLSGVSHIVATGNYREGPSKEWAEGTGLSLIYFTKAMSEATPSVMDILTGNTITNKIQGLKATAFAMTEVAKVLNSNSTSFKNGPSKNWAEGTGIALIMFVKAMNEVGEGKVDGLIKGVFGGNNKQKFKTIKDIAGLMSEVNTVLAKTKSLFNSGPSKEWAEGTGTAIMSFAKAMSDVDSSGGILDDVIDFFVGTKNETILNIAKTIVDVSNEIVKGNYSSTITPEWGTGIGESIRAIANIGDLSSEIHKSMKTIGLILTNAPTIANTMKVLNASLGGGQTLDKATSDIDRLAKSYSNLATSLNSLSNISVKSVNANLSSSNNNIIKASSEQANNINNLNTQQIQPSILNIPDPIINNENNINNSNSVTNEKIGTIETKNKVETNPFETMEGLLGSIESILSNINKSVNNIEDSQDDLSFSSPISH